MTTDQNFVARSLHWVGAGYPKGVPKKDYVPLIGVLHRSLTTDEIESLAGRLAGLAGSGGHMTADDITAILHGRTYEAASEAEVTRVSARLAAGGWPLAGRALEEEEEATDEPPHEGSVLARIVNWLREGYPMGVPEQDYVPLLALLRRRLTGAEVKKVAKALRKADISPAGPEDIAAAITRVTNEAPSDDDLRRVRARLTKKGWPVEFPDPDAS